MQRISMIAASCLVLIFPAVAVLSGCGEDYMTADVTSVTTNNGETLELTATPDNIDINGGGSVTILVYLYYENGLEISGANVNLTTTLGTLGLGSLTTDNDGVAVTTLTPGDENGWAVVVATYKNVQAMVKVSFYQDGDDAAGG